MRRASGWNISDAPSRAKRGAFSTFEFVSASCLYDGVLRRLMMTAAGGSWNVAARQLGQCHFRGSLVRRRGLNASQATAVGALRGAEVSRAGRTKGLAGPAFDDRRTQASSVILS
jgi:hypothetical protein